MTKIVGGNAALNKSILANLCESINARVKQNLGSITAQVKAVVIDTLKESPELNALRDADSKLVAVLGLERATLNERVDALIEAIADNIRITHEPFRASTVIRGHVRVEILKQNYSEILGSASAKVVYDGGTYNWVRWLIHEGDRIIISEHSVLWKPLLDFSKWSRSGHALMINKTEKASSARIPPQYSGVADDNMFLRSFIRNPNFQTKINSILYKVFQ